MKKEIVICAFNEITDWVPIHWRPYTIVYNCGIQTKKIPLEKRPTPYRFNALREGSFAEQIENLEKLLDIVCKAQKILTPAIRGEEKIEGKEKSSEPEISSPYAKAVSVNCPNSRESEQWLNHIIWRYDVLAETTFFLQGNPFDHCPDIINLVDQFDGIANFITLPDHAAAKASSNADLKLILPVYNSFFATEHTLQDAPIVRWAAGAQFVVSSKVIRQNPKTFYISLQEKLRAIPKSGEIMERIWWNILGCPQ